MSDKRAKRLRQALRADGVAVGETRYTGSTLDPKCGRGVYQRAKKIYAEKSRPVQTIKPRVGGGVPSEKQATAFKGFRGVGSPKREWTPGPLVGKPHPQGKNRPGKHHRQPMGVPVPAQLSFMKFAGAFMAGVVSATAGLKERYKRRARAARGG